MTMLAHSLKNILELIPEALPLVKQASVDQDLPLDSKDSTIATALQMKYFEKVAYHPVDLEDLEKVAKAVHVYGVKNQVEELSQAMVKAAAAKKIHEELNSEENYHLKVAAFTGDLSNLPVADRSETAKALYKEAKERNLEPCDEVVLYAGKGYLSKEAAVKALAVRFYETKNTDFVKIASAIGRTPDAYLTDDILTDLSDTVSKLDQNYGLHFKGHNFYKEAFFTKEAAFKGSLTVKIAGKEFPYESLERLGKDRIATHIGKDVAQEMDHGPQNFKAVVETLPLDMQRALANLVKNV